MSTLDKKRDALKCALWYLCASIFTALFGAIYEVFSHGVYSFFMIYAFALPLVLGALPCLIVAMTGFTLSGGLARPFYRAGVATLTVGSIAKGVLEIFGTTNVLWAFYPIVGGFFFLIGVICLIWNRS